MLKHAVAAVALFTLITPAFAAPGDHFGPVELAGDPVSAEHCVAVQLKGKPGWYGIPTASASYPVSGNQIMEVGKWGGTIEGYEGIVFSPCAGGSIPTSSATSITGLVVHPKAK